MAEPLRDLVDAVTGGIRPVETGIPETEVPRQPSPPTSPGRNFGHLGDMAVADAQDRTAVFAILYGPGDSELGWLQAGEALSAAWLKVTELGIAVAPSSAPIEVTATRKAITRLLPDPSHPFLILRFSALDSVEDGGQAQSQDPDTARATHLFRGTHRARRQAATGSHGSVKHRSTGRKRRRSSTVNRSGSTTRARKSSHSSSRTSARSASNPARWKSTTSASSPTSANPGRYSPSGPRPWRTGGARPWWSALPATASPIPGNQPHRSRSNHWRAGRSGNHQIRFGGKPRGKGPAPTAGTSLRGPPIRLAHATPPPGPRLRSPARKLRQHDHHCHGRQSCPAAHRRNHPNLARPQITEHHKYVNQTSSYVTAVDGRLSLQAVGSSAAGRMRSMPAIRAQRR